MVHLGDLTEPTLKHLICSCAHRMQYSVFGSILTIGAMLGAIVSGSIADRAGRRGVSFNRTSKLHLLQLKPKQPARLPE